MKPNDKVQGVPTFFSALTLRRRQCRRTGGREMDIMQESQNGKQKRSFLGGRCARTEGGSTKEVGEDGKGKREGRRKGACFTAVFHLLASLCLSPSPHLPLFLASHKTAESAGAGVCIRQFFILHICASLVAKTQMCTVFRRGYALLRLDGDVCLNVSLSAVCTGRPVCENA